MHDKERRRRQKQKLLDNAGVPEYNTPVSTPDHPRFGFKVLAKQRNRIKLVRFGKKSQNPENKPDKLSASYWENEERS